jgi:hypothetical protein
LYITLKSANHKLLKKLQLVSDGNIPITSKGHVITLNKFFITWHTTRRRELLRADTRGREADSSEQLCGSCSYKLLPRPPAERKFCNYSVCFCVRALSMRRLVSKCFLRFTLHLKELVFLFDLFSRFHPPQRNSMSRYQQRWTVDLCQQTDCMLLVCVQNLPKRLRSLALLWGPGFSSPWETAVLLWHSGVWYSYSSQSSGREHVSFKCCATELALIYDLAINLLNMGSFVMSLNPS